jgi:antitoxin (DNA-binding transcriptional repressor) of toxin-antitoxin stability system
MKTVSLENARHQLPQLVKCLPEGPVLLTRRGQPCAAIVALDDRFDAEAYSLSRNRRVQQLIREACAEVKSHGGIPFAQVAAEVEERFDRVKKRTVARTRATKFR